MELDQETNKQIQNLQILEQNYQAMFMQKQSIQVELGEVKTALEEVNKSKDTIFRVIGQVMVKAEKETLKKELKEKLDILELRFKSMDKQEVDLRGNIERIRGEIVSKLQ